MTDSGTRDKKVLLVTHYFLEHGSGIELIAARVAEFLRARGGWHITWAASATVPVTESPTLVDVCLPMRAWNGIQDMTGVPWPIWSPGSVLKLWRLVGACELVHLHDCLYMSNILAFLFAKMRRRPVLLTQHISMVPYKSVVLRMMMRTAYDIFGRLLLGHSDRVVFYSKEVHGDFAKRYRINGAPEFIANGVDVQRFSPVSPDERRTLRKQLYGVDDDTMVLLFVGRFVEKKGLPIVKRIAAALPDLPLVMLGFGPLQPEEWNLENVQVHRGLDNAAVAEFYQSADLLILPSIGEGLPLVMQEAMATGLPAMVSTRTAHADPVATDCLFHGPCMDELDEDGVVEYWVARIRDLAEDPETRNVFREQLRQTVLDNWTWEVCAEKYDRVMGELLESAP